MLYYFWFIGIEWEEVGFLFNKQVVMDFLWIEMGFEGIVVIDWGLVIDFNMGEFLFFVCVWGMEEVLEEECVFCIFDVGCDQFGGENCFKLIIDFVCFGCIFEECFDVLVCKLLKEKFFFGFFDNFFVDFDVVNVVVGNLYFMCVGEIV